MREAHADLWEYEPADARVILTNGTVRNGYAVMGRGCALEATERFNFIRETLGAYIEAEGNSVFFLGPDYRTPDGAVLLTFPTKKNYWEKSDVKLIVQSAKELVKMADRRGLKNIVIPRPGCGRGGLRWENVRPVLEKLFDDRFIVVHMEGK